jgi:DNA-binding transcriptional MerR regulator
MTSGSFARLAGVPLRTVQHWLAHGRLPGVEVTATGRYRIPPAYVALVREGRLPLR